MARQDHTALCRRRAFPSRRTQYRDHRVLWSVLNGIDRDPSTGMERAASGWRLISCGVYEEGVESSSPAARAAPRIGEVPFDDEERPKGLPLRKTA